MKKLLMVAILLMAIAFVAACGGGNQSGSGRVIEATFGSTFRYLGFEFVIGDDWSFNPRYTSTITVPVTITNISNDNNTERTGVHEAWSPDGLSIAAWFNTNSPTMRPGASLDTYLAFEDRGDGVYEIELFEVGRRNFTTDVVISFPITRTSASDETAETTAPETTDEITPETTDQATDLDERLFGAWVEQGDFPAWVTLTRTFNPDGTGYWWGDGPGYRFTWWVEGNVLTINAIQNDIDYEWTNVFQYEIIGDTMTFTHADGWQRVYIRESAVVTNQDPLIGVWTFRVFGDRMTVIFFEDGFGRSEFVEDGFIEEEVWSWYTVPPHADAGEIVVTYLDNSGDVDILTFRITSNNQLEVWFPDEEFPITFIRE